MQGYVAMKSARQNVEIAYRVWVVHIFPTMSSPSSSLLSPSLLSYYTDISRIIPFFPRPFLSTLNSSPLLKVLFCMSYLKSTRHILLTFLHLSFSSLRSLLPTSLTLHHAFYAVLYIHVTPAIIPSINVHL